MLYVIDHFSYTCLSYQQVLFMFDLVTAVLGLPELGASLTDSTTTTYRNPDSDYKSNCNII